MNISIGVNLGLLTIWLLANVDDDDALVGNDVNTVKQLRKNVWKEQRKWDYPLIRLIRIT